MINDGKISSYVMLEDQDFELQLLIQKTKKI